MNNVHGYRSNTDILERQDSGYTGRHGPDFINTNDSWSQGLDFRYGPGGSVYWTDWYDKNQCHSGNPDVHDKTLGRIYRIRHENDTWEKVDLAAEDSLELVEYQLHENDWYVRHARRLLHERGPDSEVHEALWEILQQNPDVTRQLRALWALHLTDGIDEDQLAGLLDASDEHLRSWAVRFLVEKSPPSAEVVRRFASMAAEEESAFVRLYLTSALQRVAMADRWEIVGALAQREEDVEDPNIPLMVWYAMEPLVSEDPERALEVALQAASPKLLTFTLRRIGSLKGEIAQKVLSAAEADAPVESQKTAIRETLETLDD